ncbi:hypothetical protein [Xylella fastidiosa]|uniref:hypothetical protein n=1 Tax=Xylella fastidiosa TaxID=2371 RepID=UPI003AFADE81
MANGACARIVAGDVTRIATEFSLTDPYRLDQVAIGSAALWGSEIVRVDRITPVGRQLRITLGRAAVAIRLLQSMQP